MTNIYNNIEIWLPIVGYEGLYEISNRGNVRSLEKEVDTRWGGIRIQKSFLMNPYIRKEKFGYLCVMLTKDKKQKHKPIHHAVAEAFIGKRPNNYDVCHNDGIRTNNNLSNLRYDTKKSNQADRKSHGTASIGETHGLAKLTEKDVKKIIELRGWKSQKELGKMFGVTQTVIGHIQTGRTWKHLDIPRAGYGK